jgi:type IV secretory pathway component VirB8
MSKRDVQQPPPQLSHRALRAYLALGEGERVQSRRWFLFTIVLSIIVFLMALALVRLIPLKERVPYFFEVDQVTGEVRESSRVISQFTPDEASIRYHLARWAENLLIVDQHSRDLRLPETARLLRGDATAQWQAFIRREQPLQKLVENPLYRRQARLISLAFLSRDTALIRLDVTDNQNVSRRVQVTVSYVIIPPKAEDDVMRNPLGLWIVNFSVTDERVPDAAQS